ncbi:Ankyrin repeats (3 copies) family protein [Babesia bovis T2Bo]|uniref:Ankyrin repeat domain containing protein n=1 Tax=Babesia bovis TaxID=5865 RepID=A7AWI5_BABBO|nr:Ankyrin repeats (3 copies) family protein [Babesia bovis T2Bo]EDO05413.1 Ankyrin repeats (3 copies) family protein [Babesia bovis T2Bo]|eukprot:XP_001608981.1 ankyrin repeat domain containing protein [Babesia bovis T2Bo]
MAATHSEVKRHSGARSSRKPAEGGRKTENKTRANNKKERTDIPPPPTPADASSSPILSPPTGISTDSFNNILSNFTQALASANGNQPGSKGSQEQLLCDMGKLFISSMMTFNQILQNHALSSNDQAVAPVAADTSKSDTRRTKPNRSKENGKRGPKVQPPSQSTSSVTKPNRENLKPIRINPEDLNDFPRNPTSAMQCDSSNTVDTPPGPGDSKGNVVTTTKNGKIHRSQRDKSAVADGAKQVNARKKMTPVEAIKTSHDMVTPISDANTTCSPAATTHSDIGSSAEGCSVKRDFSTATTPSNVLEVEEMAYLDGLASAGEQLNFNIYKFVDSCTNVNALLEPSEQYAIDKLGAWLGNHAEPMVSPRENQETAAKPVMRSPVELLRAAFMGDIESLKAQKNIDVNYVDDVGRSALHYASAAGSVTCVEYLLASGVDVNLADKKGWRAIHIAVSKNYTDVTRVLIDGGADIFALLKHKCAPARLMDVYSPAIHFAAIKGNIEITSLLLAHGATVNDLDSAKMTPLHYAAYRSNLEYLKFLLSQGAVVNMVDVNGRSPFHASALSGIIDNLRAMVEKEPFLNSEDIWALTPYKLAELRNHTDYCNYLKETLNIFEEDPDDINRVLASTIAVALQEPNSDQIYRCISRIGPELSKTVFDLTMQIERNGGVLIADGSRRRTSGGIFFTCLRELYLNDIISKDDYNYIRAAENEKRIAKAKERRNKLKAHV